MTPPTKPRVAMACSGLGNVRRGNETWAHIVAEELHQAGWPVTLFGGGPLETKCPYVRVGNWARDSFLAKCGVSWHHRYLLEQLTFAAAMKRHLQREHYDLVHVADPALGQRMQRAARELSSKVVYKDGLLLGPPWCRQFDAVQVLAPAYLEAGRHAGVDVSQWFVVPHLVDTEKFKPAEDKAAIRQKLFGEALPADAFVVLAVGDFSPGSNKRLDWIVSEMAQMPEAERPFVIFIGQASAEDTRRFSETVRSKLSERGMVVTNVKPAGMPAYYQAADVFAHAALREPFGIVFLEAMASGLPVLAHTYEVSQWIVGDAGMAVDMNADGKLAAQLRLLSKDAGLRSELSSKARTRAVDHFAPAMIIPLYERMYRQAAGISLKT